MTSIELFAGAGGLGLGVSAAGFKPAAVIERDRYYEPLTGRFVSEDPALDGSNWYAYCGNQPILKRDFTGKFGDIIEIDGWYFRTDKFGPGPGLPDFHYGRTPECKAGSIFIDGWAKHGKQADIPIDVLTKLGQNKKFQGWLRRAVNVRAGSPLLNQAGRDSVSATFNYDPFFVIGLFVVLGMAGAGGSPNDMWAAWPD